MTTKRKTKQREIILEVLKKLDHPTADEVYENVKKDIPNISLGTIYRNLESFCESGLINKIETSQRKKEFDPNIMGHYHARCIECDKLVDLCDTTFKKLEIPNIKSFFIKDYVLEFRGICEKCKKMQVEKSGKLKNAK